MAKFLLRWSIFSDLFKTNLPNHFRRSIQEICKNKSIVVLPAGKRNATVVLDSGVNNQKLLIIHIHYKLKHDLTSRKLGGLSKLFVQKLASL